MVRLGVRFNKHRRRVCLRPPPTHLFPPLLRLPDFRVWAFGTGRRRRRTRPICSPRSFEDMKPPTATTGCATSSWKRSASPSAAAWALALGQFARAIDHVERAIEGAAKVVLSARVRLRIAPSTGRRKGHSCRRALQNSAARTCAPSTMWSVRARSPGWRSGRRAMSMFAARLSCRPRSAISRSKAPRKS